MFWSSVTAVLTASLLQIVQILFCNYSRFSDMLHVLVLRVPFTAFTMVLNRSNERSGAPLAQAMLQAEGEKN